ncbi:MAG: NUDIX hydrolase [Sphaerochaetaceae bacterium]|jgi:ADP-ribose pyrophosphatase
MFDKISSKQLYQGKSYSFSLDTISLPSGRNCEIEQLHHPGGVVILALDEQKRIVLVSQYRYAVKAELLEFPAGKLDKIPNETPEKGAVRELREETGYVAKAMTYLGEVYPSPGVVTEVLHLFVATGLNRTSQQLDDDEFITIRWVEKDELLKMIAGNTIRDAKTICAFTLALLKKII